jgi:hypothetical protein
MHRISVFPGHCGSRIFHQFYIDHNADYSTLFNEFYYNTAFAIFIERLDQKRAYEALKKKFKILYQSPVLQPKDKINQNPYFIVIYLNEKP